MVSSFQSRGQLEPMAAGHGENVWQGNAFRFMGINSGMSVKTAVGTFSTFYFLIDNYCFIYLWWFLTWEISYRSNLWNTVTVQQLSRFHWTEKMLWVWKGILISNRTCSKQMFWLEAARISAMSLELNWHPFFFLSWACKTIHSHVLKHGMFLGSWVHGLFLPGRSVRICLT